ncbi:hypothetical protein Btru_071118 [Bulinus truncatus]|nr:hypothetical protein Btru_071118 [Bulinus truncatus]
MAPKAKSRKEDLEEEFSLQAVVIADSFNVRFGSVTHKKPRPLKALQLTIGPSQLTKKEFISEGWHRVRRSAPASVGAENDESVLVKKVHIELKEKDQWFNIDGESFEAMPGGHHFVENKLRECFAVHLKLTLAMNGSLSVGVHRRKLSGPWGRSFLIYLPYVG